MWYIQGRFWSIRTSRYFMETLDSRRIYIFFSSSNMESFGWFLTLHQEIRFFLSLVWQEQIYIDKRKKVGAIWNKIGNHWFFNISVAKISMFLPSLFFCSQRFQHFFKFLPREKGKRKFSRIITLNAGYSYSNDCEFMKIIHTGS